MYIYMERILPHNEGRTGSHLNNHRHGCLEPKSFTKMGTKKKEQKRELN